MQFDFDSAMGYGPNQKFTSAGDAVVPSLTPRVSGFSQYPFNMQSAGSAFDKAAYDLPLKPLYEISGACSTQTNGGFLSPGRATDCLIILFVMQEMVAVLPVR